MRKAVSHAGIARVALIGAVLAGFVMALLLAVSPELHELAHHGSEEAEHQCLVTVLQTGGCADTAPEAAVVTGLLASIFGTVPIGESALVESLFLSGSVCEHAPPFVS